VRDRIKALRRVRADHLEPHPDNWRRHPNRQRRILEDVLAEVGVADAVIARELDGGRYQIIDGHLRTEVLAGERVPVLVLDVDEAEARKLLLSIDPLASLALTDKARLVELATAIGPHSAGLEDLIRTVVPGRIQVGEVDPPPRPSKPTTRRGDLWTLGDHRLLCGDATEPADVARLMEGDRASLLFTDPPYGVDYVGKMHSALKIANDALGHEGTRALARDALIAARPHLAPGAAFYVCAPSGSLELAFRLALVDAGFGLRQAIVWVKDVLVLGRMDYHWRHESILAGEVIEPPYAEHESVLYGWLPGAAHAWNGSRSQDTVWEIPRPKASAEHPTMKPLELVLRTIALSSERDAAVLDPFVGSGTTIVAAEMLGRRARAMELDPGYVEVAVARWQARTGGDPVLER